MDEFDRFVTIMRGMDAAVHESRAKKQKQAADLQAENPQKPKLLPKPLK